MTEQAQYISGRTVQEQMDNLIKYVDDRSKTVAEEEAQRVLVPAENAKVAAEAAADRAVSSVGQFESRLGGVEDGVAGNRSSIQTIDGEITDIYNDLTNVVRKVGEAGQVVMNGLDLRGTNTTSDTAIGTDDTQIANGHRVIQELNAYSPMVRTTGTQVIAGEKSFTSEIRTKFNALDIDVIPGADQYPSFIRFVDKDGDSLGNIGGIETAGQSYRSFGTRAKMTNGEIKSFSLQLRVDRSTKHFVVQVAWPDGSYTTLAEKTIS